MPTYPQAAVEYSQFVKTTKVEAVLRARRLWRLMNPQDLSLAWALMWPQLDRVVQSAQSRVALEGATAGSLMLAQRREYVPPQYFIDASPLVGDAPDGRDLEGMLYSSVTTTKEAIGGGASLDQALSSGMNSLEKLVGTVIADTARQSMGLDIYSRPGVGYVRMLNPPSCSRCVMLAGRWYRSNKGFRRHPRCFPAGTVVSGPESLAATRRWYEGELVTLSTAGGKKLSLTGNHPVLTGRGWVPANLLEVGDEVFSSAELEGATALEVPDHNQVPALIEDVWSSFSVGGSVTMPSTAEDFHGDGGYGEVDIVRADSALLDWSVPEFFEQAFQLGFAGGLGMSVGFPGQGSAGLFDSFNGASAGGSIRGGYLEPSFFESQLGIAHEAGFAHVSAFDSGFLEQPSNRTARDAMIQRESVFARASLIGANDVIDGEQGSGRRARWDAPGLAFVAEARAGYAAVGRDLKDRLAGKVHADRLVHLSRGEFRGHVYSLNSSEGWHTANSLIVSNCDCTHIPARENRAGDMTTDPYEAFDSMSAEDQEKTFGKANAQAIRDGADMYQVVNAQRGTSYAGISSDGTFRGQRAGSTTLEGSTRRGYFGGLRKLEGDAFSNAGTGGRYTRAATKRLTPEAIYQQNLSRERTLDLLRSNGYVLPTGQVAGGSIRYPSTGSASSLTAAEQRVRDARLSYEAALQGRNPYGKGPATQIDMAMAEKRYRQMLATNGEIFID